MKIFISVFILFVCMLGAQTSFEEFQKKQTSEFENYKNKEAKELANYFNRQDSLFIQYKEQIEQEWNEYVESTNKEWVSYSQDFRGRSNVNFETGKIQVDAVMPAEDEKAEEKAVEMVKEQLKSIVKEIDETKKPILQDQVQNPVDKKEIITPKNIEKIAEKIVKNAKKTTITGSDNKKRVKYSVSLEMVPDHVKKRAEQYRPFIEEKCKRFQVSPAVALAIIHTESYFNPKAYNRHGNAHGLMQIVPKYAGLTMNNVLYKKKSEPTSDDLFNPQINLEMGIGYIRWLADNKWKEVTNPTNQYYCIICSYNGGVGSVYKAMMGKMKGIKQAEMDKMRHELSTMSNDKLYNKLHKDIPWEETRKYIKLVKEKMDTVYAQVESKK